MMDLMTANILGLLIIAIAIAAMLFLSIRYHRPEDK